MQVTALSRGIESNETSVSVGTRPLAPSIESAGSAGSAGSAVSAGSALRLTWRSDVNSRQDSYRLRYRRLGADRYQTVTTRDTAYTLADLFPGAVYEIQIAALSHDLLSEPQTLFKPVSESLVPVSVAATVTTHRHRHHRTDSAQVRCRPPSSPSAAPPPTARWRSGWGPTPPPARSASTCCATARSPTPTRAGLR